MKHFIAALSALALVFVVVSNLTVVQQDSAPSEPVQAIAVAETKARPTTENWQAEVQKDITSREYYLHRQEDGNWQSPNRANNTRIKYSSDHLHVEPRTLEQQAAPDPAHPEAEAKQLLQFEDYTLDIRVLGYGTEEQLTHAFHPQSLTAEDNTAEAADAVMRVEYVNNETGTRQNFIINEPVQGNELAVHLSLHTTLQAALESEGSLVFNGKEKDTKLYYRDLKVWDATGKTLPARMELTPHGDTYQLLLAVNTEGAQFPVTIDPLVTSGSLTNADWRKETNVANSYMGWSVGAAGDVNGDGYGDVVVSAYGYTNSFSSEGAVYIFHGSATGLSTTAATTIYGGSASLYFGFSVNSAGDINADGYSDVVVGVRDFANGQSSEGAVYIYHGSASGISSSYTTRIESNIASGNMGSEVACAGDVNGDGYSDIVVGAESYTNGESVEGAFWVFHGSASGINTTAARFVESNTASMWMGKAVNGAGDVNGDGYSDILVGLYGYSNAYTNEGATYVYHGSASGIGASPTTILTGGSNSARMGESVAFAGDVNGDGYSDVVAGLLAYTNGQNQEGAAAVYHGSASGVSTSPAIRLEPNVANANMGTDVGCAGDVNGDGYADIIVGAYGYTNGQSNEGALFVYKGSSTGISSTVFSLVQSNTTYTNLGISCGSAGDVNGDGYSDVIAGAYFYANGQSNEGLVCAFYGSASGISTTATATVAGSSVGMNLGTAVASAGDVNGDGYNDVVVGAQAYTNGQSSEGVIFIYHGSATGMNTTPAATVESNQAVGYLGRSVSCAGDVNGDGYSDVVAGAFGYDNGQTDEGVAFVFHGSASGLVTTPAVMLESNQAGSYMGYAVGGAGDVNGDGYSDVVVGAYYYTNGNTNEGAAFVYHGSSTGIGSSPAIILESNKSNTWLGYSAGAAGDVNGDGYSDIILGANYYTNGQSFEGAFYVYHGSATGVAGSVSTLVESNLGYVQMGFSVAGAGDVNGDGYSDVLVGVNSYDNGQNDEGAVFVYHGSSGGVSLTAAVTLESNQASAEMGRAVAGAGDVNGDGYSDIVVGVPYFSNGQNGEGIALLYHGSSSGVSSTAAAQVEVNQVNAILGFSVACAGDVNGDGYSDMVASGPLYDNGTLDEGIFCVYHGNSGTGKRNIVRLYNTDLATPIQRTNVANTTFGLGLYASSPQGKQGEKLVWEVKQQGQAFSAGSTITNSVSNTSAQSSFSSSGLSGINLTNLVTKPGMHTKVRCRVQYDLVTSITGQKYGPWRYPQGYLSGQFGMSSTPLPVEWLNFTAQWLTAGESAQLNWSTASEKNNSHFTILRSTDGTNWEERGTVRGAGTSTTIRNYTFPDKDIDDLHTNTVYYRLMQTDYNGSFTFSSICRLNIAATADSRFEVGPNPVAGTVFIRIKNPGTEPVFYSLTDARGREQVQGQIPGGNDRFALSFVRPAPGVYLLRLVSAGQTETFRLVYP